MAVVTAVMAAAAAAAAVKGAISPSAADASHIEVLQQIFLSRGALLRNRPCTSLDQSLS